MKIFQIMQCPFCGMAPHVSYNASYAIIHCMCGCSGPHIRTPIDTEERIEVAVRLWNKRDPRGQIDNPHEFRYKEWNER